jgi:hypothetical protein
MFAAFEQAEWNARTAHLPSTMPAAILYYRELLPRYHAAVLACDISGAGLIHEEAQDLAATLNGGTHFGIIAQDDSPGCVLERETAATPGQVPLYGQLGQFNLDIEGIPIRIEMDGIFGVGTILPGFSAHAVDYERPFISATGYRTFPRYQVEYVSGTTPDQLVRQIILNYIAVNEHGLKGKLVRIGQEYIHRHNAERKAPPAS